MFVDPKGEYNKYWVCKVCYTERGGKPYKSGNTLCLIGCGYCKGENQGPDEFITPIVDIIWPTDKSLK